MKMSLWERIRSSFDDPFREVEAFGVKPGLKVGDIGAGSGYFTFPAAETVGPEGMVFAVEPDPSRYERLLRRKEKEGRSNVVVVKCKAERMEVVPDAALDLAFSVHALHHFEDKRKALLEVGRVLRSGGALYIRDVIRGRLFRHGTRRDEVPILSEAGFKSVEILENGRYLKARLTK